MPELGHIHVHDAMHPGIVSCAPDTRVTEAAAIMAEHHVHALAVAPAGASAPHGIVSDLDVLAALAAAADVTVAQVAATEPLTVASSERLHRAAQLMAEHGVAHLIVADPASGAPVGVLSTLDILGVFAQLTVT